MLSLIDITKDYTVGTERIHALRGITVDFRQAEFVSVLGASGCGKTTLMNIIGGLDKCTSGELCVDGRSTIDFKDSDWDNYRNKRVGFVFQTYNLIPHLTVLGNVEIALTLSGISKDERRKKALAALKEVGLEAQEKQRPNQLSGGQMQRVAIARALVNSPEILLADEPTGALDSKTSEQIMELIKRISKGRLVIMVTHNPDIAERYSTRLIRMSDGLIVSDSDPFTYQAQAEQPASDQKPKKEKSSMNYLTALSLSWRNLGTKKGRTILTSIAGSIGIVGIALILALSSGMNNYVTRLQRDTLASNPITISSSTFDFTQAMQAMRGREQFEQFPSAKEVYVEKAITASELMVSNNLSSEYIDYLESNLDSAWYNDIIYKTGQQLNFYTIKPDQTEYRPLNEGAQTDPYSSGISAWQLMLNSTFIASQYDLLDGEFVADTDDASLALIVGSGNQISDETLKSLGLLAAGQEKTKYTFDELLGKSFKLVLNDAQYVDIGSKFTTVSPVDIDYDACKTVTISAIMRAKAEANGGVLSSGIGYTKALYSYVQQQNLNSEIVQFMLDNPTLNPLSGIAYEPTFVSSASDLRDADLRMYGGDASPNEINIYPKSFDAKTSIQQVLDNYNVDKDSEDMVTYTDMSALLGESLGTLIDIITSVLIGFTSISLVVSSIMIAIITYVSVIERTKEIGVLRSIGARKKDVTRVFNAETIIIGAIAGTIGVASAYLLSIPINLIVGALLDVQGIASLGIGFALLLVLISVGLTLVSGLIPAFKAAKQNPVNALRTE